MSAHPTAIPAPAAAGRRTSIVFASFIAMLALAALDQTVLSTALPSIGRDLQAADRLPWLFSAYLMAATVAVPLYGRLADLHGSRPLLLAAVLLFLLGSLGCGAAGSLGQLIVARAVQGAGGGGLLTLTLLAVVELVPPQRRGPMQGALGASYGLSTMFGPLLGAAFVEHLSWRWAFFFNVPVALLALPVIAFGLPRRATRGSERVDVVGAALLALALASLLLATRRDTAAAVFGGIGGGNARWALLALGTALALVFVWNQRRARHPILPLALFGQPAFAAATLLSAVTGVALFSVVVFLPSYLQTVLHLSPTAAAWHLLPLMAGITTAAVGGGRRLRGDAPPLRSWAIGGCLLMALACTALASAFRWAAAAPLAFSACVLPLGLGIGLLFPLITAAAQSSAPPRYIGVATSTPIMLRSLGGALGVAALGVLLSHGIAAALSALPPQHGGGGAAFAAAAQPVYAIVALVSLLGALAACWLPSRLPSRVSSAPAPEPAPLRRA